MKKGVLATALVSLLGLSGCQLTQTALAKFDELKLAANKQAAPEIIEKSIKTESVNYSFVQGKKRQTKNKVSVTLEPVSVEDAEIFHKVSLKPALTLVKVNGKSNYQATYNPVVDQDDRLRFTLKVANASSRVLRPSGSVLTFNIDGKSTSVSQDEYAELVNVMIVPNNSQEIVIQGPKLSELKKDKGVLAIDLYEVKIGNKLSNYNWILQYEKTAKTIDTVIKTEKLSMTPKEAFNYDGKIIQL